MRTSTSGIHFLSHSLCRYYSLFPTADLSALPPDFRQGECNLRRETLLCVPGMHDDTTLGMWDCQASLTGLFLFRSQGDKDNYTSSAVLAAGAGDGTADASALASKKRRGHRGKAGRGAGGTLDQDADGEPACDAYCLTSEAELELAAGYWPVVLTVWRNSSPLSRPPHLFT